MSNPRLKDENFVNMGGINIKASPYVTGPQQFLEIRNFDFQMPGSLTKRWGSTQYISQSYTGQIQSLYEFEQLSGASQFLFSTPTGLWYGATQGQFQGASLPFLSTGYTAGPYTSFINGTGNAGGGAIQDGLQYFYIFADGTRFAPPTFGVTTEVFSILPTGLSGNQFDFVNYNNTLYLADGTKFLKFSGSTFYRYGFSPVVIADTQGAGGGIFNTGTSYFIGSSLYTHILFSAFENSDGVRGPAWPLFVASAGNGNFPSSQGTSFFHVFQNIHIPSGYDIKKVVNYHYFKLPTGTTIAGYDQQAITQDVWFTQIAEMNTFTITPGSTVMQIKLGYQTNLFNGASAYTSAYSDATKRLDPQSPIIFGLTMFVNGSSQFNIRIDPSAVSPKYLELYNNQLFMAGFSSMASTVIFSDVGLPEVVQDTNNFEVRSNDGDVIRAMKSYLSSVVIGKTNSFFTLSGDDPDNFNLRQVSDEYGFLSNRAVALYNNDMVFLDRRGICKFNGANVSIISQQVQDVFDRMNVNAAIDNATMIHDKQRNQVLCGIPIDGSTMNNITIVYDYFVNAWTKYDGYNPAVYALARGVLNNRAVMFGGYTGLISNFGSSYFGDNGVGITCFLKTRYLHDLGESTEKQWRRLYLNVDPVVSSTQAINIKMFQNYGSNVAATFTMYANPFQSRIDFGLSAKSLAFELANFNATEQIRVHGFVLSYRFQRDT